jgi:hypothetical protein
MKKAIFKIWMLAVSLLSFYSCEDWLTLSPTSEMASSNFWTNAGQGEYTAYLQGCYSQLRSDNTNIFYLGEMRSDNVANGTNMGGEATQGMERFWQHTLNSVNAGVTNFGGFYTNINRINVLIKHTQDTLVSKQNIPDTFRKQILGKAYGLRAFYYFQLLKSWGKIVINTEENTTEGAPSGNFGKKASNENEVMALIKNDINLSQEYFGKTVTAAHSEWSLAATLPLMGEVYLWSAQRMGGGVVDAAVADSALSAIVTSRKFSLVARNPTAALEFTNFNTNTPFRAVFDFSNRGNSEEIFAIKYSTTETAMSFVTANFLPQQTYLASFYPDSTSGTAFNKTQENYGGIMRVALNPNLLKLFDASDTRKNVSIKDAYRRVGLRYELQSVYLYKYQGTNLNGVRQLVDDYIVYRYADVLLLLDEARGIQGTVNWSGLNQIRRRAFNVTASTYNYPHATLDTGIYADPANWQEILLRERQWEFIGEGKRWFDLVRMGNEYVKKYTNVQEDWQILMPIDQNSLTLNPLLDPTPGYN